MQQLPLLRLARTIIHVNSDKVDLCETSETDPLPCCVVFEDALFVHVFDLRFRLAGGKGGVEEGYVGEVV